MRPNIITRADLLTLIEEVSFGKAVIGGADRDGVVVDGYLDLLSAGVLGGIAPAIGAIWYDRSTADSMRNGEQVWEVFVKCGEDGCEMGVLSGTAG